RGGRGAGLAAGGGGVAALVDTKQAMREAARALRHAEARLPDRRELAVLLAEVARSACEARLDLVSLRPKAERALSDHVEVPVELDIRGSYPRTVGFLRRLEHLSRLVHVRDLKLERQNSSGGRVVLHASCTALTYRLLDPPGDVRATPAGGGRGGEGGGGGRKGGRIRRMIPAMLALSVGMAGDVAAAEPRDPFAPAAARPRLETPLERVDIDQIRLVAVVHDGHAARALL